MNNKDKQLIADYMELIFNPARMSLYEYKDGREFKFNSTDASFCVQEMQKRGDWERFCANVFILFIDEEKSSYLFPKYIAWLFNADNFHVAMAEWLRSTHNG